jgi:tetratricopeptide (TPR) repeat protein
MVGRAEQLNEILRYIAAIGAPEYGGPNVLFLTGEAGIGKTTMLNAIREELISSPGAPIVAMVECSTPLAGHDIGEIEALQPWALILAQLADDDRKAGNTTRKLVMELAGAWVKFVPFVGDFVDSVINTTKILKEHSQRSQSDGPQLAVNQQQIFQQYINVLGKLAEKSTTVLMVDDFHWADTSSTNLLFAAARQLRGKPILFIIAYRPDDAAGSRNGEGHPILHARNEMERYSLAVEIGLPNMTPADLDRLLRERYPGYHNDPLFEQWLLRVSSGNALFITQFLQTLEEDGYIESGTGVIKEGFEQVTAPQSAQAVIQERIRRMNDETRELLRYASVEGDVFTSMLLAKVTEVPQLKLLQRLRIIEQTHQTVRSLGKQQVYARQTTAYEFAHALLQKLMYESLEEEERELLHQAIFEALKEEWEIARDQEMDLTGIAARLATHATVLGEHRFAAQMLLEGARDSWREYSEQETLRQISQAMESIQKSRLASERRGAAGERENEALASIEAEALMLRGEAAQMSGRNAPALADYEAASGKFKDVRDTGRMIAAMERASRIHLLNGNYPRAEEISMEALGLSEQSGDWKGEGEALLRLGEIARFHRDTQRALEYTRRALDIYQSNGYESGRGSALSQIGSIYMASSGPVDGLPYLQQAADIFHSIGETHVEAQALSACGMAYTQTGDLAKAQECHRRSLDIQRRMGDVQGEAKSLTGIAIADYYLGEIARALDSFEKSGALHQAHNNPMNAAFAFRGAGVAHRDLGHYDRALENFHRSLAFDREIGNRVGEANSLLCIGMVYHAQGNLAMAMEVLQQSLAILQEADSRESLAQTLSVMGAVYLDMNDPVAALDHLERALDLARTIGDRTTEISTSISIGAAYRLLGRFDESRDLLNGALTLARDSGFDTYVADALAELALVNRSEATTTEGMERSEHLRKGMELLEEAVRLHRKHQGINAEKWERELASFRQEMESGDSSDPLFANRH